MAILPACADRINCACSDFRVIKLTLFLILFRPEQLRRLFVVIQLSGNPFDLGLDVAKQVVHFNGTVRPDNIFIFYAFEHKVGEQPMSLFTTSPCAGKAGVEDNNNFFSPCKYRALTVMAALPRCNASYPLPVRQTSALPSASSRFAVTRDTLAVRLTLPLAG